ncbi:MAG: hypothetical protein A4E35_01011 [Methanoregula sp. PtaU1.Bin051]|nr:MAG: hypothetical protein A4E35_01011 [Methanoregula sp. PtaU1.Bin051]
MPIKSFPEKIVIPLVITGLMLIIAPCTAGIQIQAGTNIALARGDPLTITGTGLMNGSVAIWGIGPSFFTYQAIPVAPDGTVSWELGRDVTRSFRSGPLMIIVQDPGHDRQYSLRAGMSMERIRIAWENGTSMSEWERGPLDIPAAMDLADTVRDGIAGSGTDDSCTLAMVMVEEPAIHFRHENPDEFPTVVAGERVWFSGTTNIAPENRITARIEDTAVIGKTGSRIPVRSGEVTIERTGDLQNRWEYTLDTEGLASGEYLFEIGWDQSAVSGQSATIFRIIRQSDESSGTPLRDSHLTGGEAPRALAFRLPAPSALMLLYETTS